MTDLWVGLPTFTRGDRVRFIPAHAAKFAGLYTVTKVNKVNLSVEGDNGKLVSVHPSFLIMATADEQASAVLVPIPEHFVVGQTVRVGGRPDSEVYVILKPTPRGYSCARLGGDNDRYLNCPVQILTSVKVDWSIA